MEVSLSSDNDNPNVRKPTSFWIVEWIHVKELTSEWTDFKKTSIKSPDLCYFTYSARISSKQGLDVQVRKRNVKPAKANITISFIDMSVDKMVKMEHWTEDYCFSNVIGPTELQTIDRVHVMILNVWYGFNDELPPAPPLKLLCPGSDYFYLNEELSDFKIVIGDVVLPVHKFLLAAHSREFFKMFVTPMKESQENRVVIEDIELVVMKEVLNYMYTRDTRALADPEMALKVLVVAEKYGLEALKYACQSKLYKNLTIDNALVILDVADMYNAQQLRKYTIQFLTAHKKEIVHKSDFRDLYHRKPELLFDFITMALEK